MESSDFSATNSSSQRASAPPRHFRLGWLLGLLLLGGGGLGVWWVLAPGREPVPATAQQPAMPVKTLTLQPRLIQERSEFIANVRSRRSVTLRPRIQGQITQILVTPGERVTTRTVLIQIDPDEQQAAVSSTSAAVESAQANVDNARAILRSLEAERVSKLSDVELNQQEYERYTALAEVGAVSQQTRDQYANRIEVAQANLSAITEQMRAQQAAVVRAEKAVQEAQARIQEQRVQLQYFQIAAPFAGVVGDIPVKVGDFVDTSTELISVSENDLLEVNFSISAEQATQLRVGSPVELFDSQGRKLGTSQVFFIAPNTANTTQSVLVKALLDNSDGQLRTDQFVRASVIWNQQPGVLIPTTAVTRLGGEAFVYVIEPSESGFVARQRLVELGSVEGNDYQVLDGLEPGESIVTSGVLALRDGVPITPES
ncbi:MULTISPECIES: efflux RND transporter periplasmic adaptor subunit [Cyanophyceae]|uniref:efflux RND transporter periplasmic adaptor subunit n=1 Tax=Chroococcidiopsis sp. TS-821 TaxID=1378066 RepID=UPI000CEDCDBC|nr:efflux RND transporter periplasmic adaptor subunit [Chroococcidiopsis sp. TS-821]PPS41881.1 efflux transporter periplasmic adaptor subunit [Chroococcidiopsis sp. TS-821]